MNRRKFLTSGTLGLGAFSMLPSTIIASNNAVSISEIGKGFERLSNRINLVSIQSLSQNFNIAHKKLSTILDEKGYYYPNSEVTKLSDYCFCIPLVKKPIVGFETRELALLLKENDKYHHYILNEKITAEFGKFIADFDNCVDDHQLHINSLEFTVPHKILSQPLKGKESLFIYENIMKNKISVKSNTKRSHTFIN